VTSDHHRRHDPSVQDALRDKTPNVDGARVPNVEVRSATIGTSHGVMAVSPCVKTDVDAPMKVYRSTHPRPTPAISTRTL